MRLTKILSELRRCKRGNTLVVVAATAPLMIAASAIGLDTIQLTLAKRQLQRSADSAAMAGAHSVIFGQTAAGAVDRDLTLNNLMVLSSPREVQNAPLAGPYAGNMRAVRVILKAKRVVPFMSFFTGSSVDIEVEATAAAVPDGTFCVVSLEDTAETGVTFAGSNKANLGCGVATNSTGPTAIAVTGTPVVIASPVAAVGVVADASKFQGATTTIPYNVPQPDPFAQLGNPVVPATCNPEASVQPTETATLEPGCYRGMDLKGTVTLRPGTYIIDGGTLSFGSQANVTGNGVVFVMTSSNAVSNPASITKLSMNGGAVLNLSAPTSGEYSGMLFYQDRRAPDDKPHINGHASSVIDGAFYLPSQDVTFNGSAGMTLNCFKLVVRRVTFSGTSNLENTCSATDPRRGYTGYRVRLVG